MTDETRVGQQVDQDPGLKPEGAGDTPRGAVGGEVGTGTGLTGGTEIGGPGADAGVTSGTRATATEANLAETEAIPGRDG
jgi:hypothetical protein